jgi:hypothetical protein
MPYKAREYTMQQLERISRLRSMLQQVAPDHDLEALSVPDDGQLHTTESIKAAETFGRPYGSAGGFGAGFGPTEAASGLRKLQEHREGDMSREEMLGIEAIVLARDRPAVFVRAETYDQIGGVWTDLDTSAVRGRINPMLGSIGRIELPNMHTIPYGGTGFLVGDGVLMTNRHVARLFTEGLGTRRLLYRPGDAAIDFKCEIDSQPDPASFFTIERVLMVHPYWDMALLKVAGLSGRYRPLTLSVRAPEDLVDHTMMAVGYPARDPRNDMALQDRIFGGVFNVKRLQPGKVRSRSNVRSFENDVDAMVHDSSTLGGNSGSAIIDADSGRVIGLHFAGEYLKANYAVPSYELARDRRVLDAGVRFDGKVAVTDRWDHAWRSADAGMAEAGAADPALQQSPAAASAASSTPAVADGQMLQVPIPLTLRVAIGVGDGAAQFSMAQAGMAQAYGASVGERRDTTTGMPRRLDGTRRISMRELQDMVRDPQVPERELRPYFIASPDSARPFAPAVIPNPALVDVAEPRDRTEGAMMMSWANGLSRLRRQERFRARMAAGDRRPVLVSEGDSWFQFPMLLADVIDQLAEDYNVWSVDAAGDTLQNMVFDHAEYLAALRQHAGTARAFLFSGGGNDVVGADAQGNPVIARLVRGFEDGKPADWYVATAEANRTFAMIEDGYRSVLDAVRREFPDLPVLCHGYGYAIPGGAPGDTRHPAWAAVDKWLGAPMRERLGIRDPALQRDIVRLLIDRFNDMLRRLCGASHPQGAFGNAWYVDVRDTVRGRWADELHPTDEGFAAVGQVFEATLRRALGTGTEMARGGMDPERTPNIGDDDEAVRMLAREEGSYVPSPVPAWRTARAIDALRTEVNAQAPNRSKASDGTIGDAAHRSRSSDHNPWVDDDGTGVVTAIDITHSPATGCDAGKLAQSLQSRRDARVKYVIWNRRIANAGAIDGAAPWTWRPYNGSNPHDKHVHISIKSDKQYYDDAGRWDITV